MRKRIIIIVLFIILWIIIPISIFSTNLIEAYTIDDNPQLSGDDTFTLYPIIPYPSTDGNIELGWDNIESVDLGFGVDIVLIQYNVFRKKDSGIFKLINFVTVEHYYDDGLDVGTYEYKIIAVFTISYVPWFCYSNVESIIVQEAVSPLSGESILINYGDWTTNSYDVELSLHCNNAEEMSFKLSSDTDWTVPEPYMSYKYITLPESSVDNPNYTVGVKYKKDTWETEPVYDDINVYIEGVPPPPPPNGDDKPVDYTLAYILIGVLIGLIGIGVFLKYRKQIIKSK